MAKKKRLAKIVRRQGSRRAAIEKAILSLIQRYRLQPSALAIILSHQLRTPVYRREVWKVLRQNNCSRKMASLIPSLSVPEERKMYVDDLKVIWTNPNQILFFDEKKFKTQEIFDRSQGYGYAPFGERLPLTTTPFCIRPDLPRVVEVAGAISVLEDADHRPLEEPDESGMGVIGITSMLVKMSKLNILDVINFIEKDVVSTMNPYPGPRSILLLDNMPSHRTYEKRIRRAVNWRGGILLWNPPQSPDLNPIEKLWDVVLAWTSRRIAHLLTGATEPARVFCISDLLCGLQEARLGLKSYETCLKENN
jgi:transposase